MRQATLALCLTLAPFAAAAEDAAERALRPNCGGLYNLCGFVDRKTGAQQIPFRFERTFDFSEGLAGVRVDGRYGYTDPTGALAIPAQYDAVGPFQNGLAEVVIGDKAGLIDRTGRIVLAPTYARALPLTADVALVQNGRAKIEGDGGRRGFFFEPSLGFPGTYPLSLKTGQSLAAPMQIKPFGAGRTDLFWATPAIDSNAYLTGPFGLLRADGSWLMEPIFSMAQPLMDDRAVVCTGRTGTPDHRCGVVDGDGRMVVPLRDWFLFYWDNGFGIAQKDGKKGLVDKAGALLGGRWFDDVERPEAVGGIPRVKIDGRWQGIAPDGRLVTDPLEGKVIAACPAGLTMVLHDGLIRILGADGQPTTPDLFDRTYLDVHCDRPSPVRRAGRWGYVRPDGHRLGDFEKTYSFVNGHAAVQVGGLWGIIDDAGRFTLAPRYQELAPTVAGLFRAKLDGREFYIDALGDERPAPPAPGRRAYQACSSGAVFISRGEGEQRRLGLAAPDGRILIPADYRAVHCYRNGFAWVPLDDLATWCPVAPDGEIKRGSSCLTARHPEVWYDAGPETLSPDPYESSVLWTRAALEFGAGLRATPPRLVSTMGTTF
jgi:hypothetical protein